MLQTTHGCTRTVYSIWTAENSWFVTGHFPKAFIPALEPTHLIQWAPRAISFMAKRPEREADYSISRRC